MQINKIKNFVALLSVIFCSIAQGSMITEGFEYSTTAELYAAGWSQREGSPGDMVMADATTHNRLIRSGNYCLLAPGDKTPNAVEKTFFADGASNVIVAYYLMHRTGSNLNASYSQMFLESNDAQSVMQLYFNQSNGQLLYKLTENGIEGACTIAPGALVNSTTTPVVWNKFMIEYASGSATVYLNNEAQFTFPGAKNFSTIVLGRSWAENPGVQSAYDDLSISIIKRAEPKAVPQLAEVYPDIHIGRGLPNHLKVLGFWGKQPELEPVYAAAFAVLEQNPSASFVDVAADPLFQELCRKADIKVLGGPMLGAVSEQGAKVWLRTLTPAKVEVLVTFGGKEKVFGPVQSLPEADLTAVVEITGLPPGSRIPYRVLVDGVSIPLPEESAITTAPAPHAPTRVVFGSCFHTRLGDPDLSRSILARSPAAFLMLGDVAVDDKGARLGLARADYLLRDWLPAWRNLAARVPLYAVWDDHDYFDNDVSGIPNGHTAETMRGVWEVFRRAWNNPSYPSVEGRHGLYFRTRIGAFDVIMLDTRAFRVSRPGEKNAFLGETQMKWLFQQLLECKAPFIIISSGTMWSDAISNGKDSWGMWDPVAREEIFAYIEKNRIPGVLLISGDRHGARGIRIPRPSGFAFYEFEPASLGGWFGPGPGSGGDQLFGIVNKAAFGEFSCDPAPADPEVVFRLIDKKGEVLNETKLTRSQLTPP